MKAELIEEMELIKRVRHYLRFQPGDVVFLKSDMDNKTPLTIKKILPLSQDEDYLLTVNNNQNQLENYFLFDKMLKKIE